MNREEILAQVIEFAAQAYKVDASTLTEETNLNEFSTSSVNRVAMSASIENEYDVMIPVARFGNYDSIAKIVDFIIEEAE